MHGEILTYDDTYESLVDFLAVNRESSVERDVRRAIASAYRQVPTVHDWNYYTGLLRLSLVAPYSAGTVEYTHTGGAHERMVTLSGGTWPEWAADGDVILGSLRHRVASRVNDNVLTLEIASNPGGDIAAGTTYRLIRDSYPAPADFVSCDELESPNRLFVVEYIHPRDWQAGRNWPSASAGVPTGFTVMGDENFIGALAIKFAPHPVEDVMLEGIYRRRPRALTVQREERGTVAVTSNSATVTGAGTRFGSQHVGCVLRVSEDPQQAPTSRVGSNPAIIERIVMDVTGTGGLVVDHPADRSIAGTKYTLSDPVDVEPGAMANVFLRLCERELAFRRRLEGRREIAGEYELAAMRAREADSRYTGVRVAGRQVPQGNLWRAPRGADIP